MEKIGSGMFIPGPQHGWSLRVEKALINLETTAYIQGSTVRYPAKAIPFELQSD